MWTSQGIHNSSLRKVATRARQRTLALEPLESRDLLATFLPAVSYAPGAVPRMATAADLNTDGALDLAVANGQQVNVLLGNGDGTFQPRQPFDLGINALALAPGDFNGDGLLDVATANPEGIGLSVLLGNGDGTFWLAGHYEIYVPYMIVARDFNSDGPLDLVLTTDHGSTVNLFVGNGDGTFGTPRRTAPAGRDARWLEVEDLNGDGLLDLVLPSSTALLWFLSAAPAWATPPSHTKEVNG